MGYNGILRGYNGIFKGNLRGLNRHTDDKHNLGGQNAWKKTAIWLLVFQPTPLKHMNQLG